MKNKIKNVEKLPVEFVRNKNEYISFRFNKRILIVSDKYGYISLDSIVRSQYYYPFKNDGFIPIKCTGKKDVI